MSRVRITSNNSAIAADFVFPATTTISETLSNNISEYPVESGFSISDNVARNNTRLEIDGTFTPIAFNVEDDLFLDPTEAYNTLLALNDTASELTITAYDRVYTNMYISNLSFTKNGAGYDVSMSLTKVRVTNVSFALLPYVAEDKLASGSDEARGNTGGSGTNSETVVDAQRPLTEAEIQKTTDRLETIGNLISGEKK